MSKNNKSLWPCEAICANCGEVIFIEVGGPWQHDEQQPNCEHAVPMESIENTLSPSATLIDNLQQRIAQLEAENFKYEQELLRREEQYKSLQVFFDALQAEKQQLEADCAVMRDALMLCKDRYLVGGETIAENENRRIVALNKALSLNSGKSLLERAERMERVGGDMLALLRNHADRNVPYGGNVEELAEQWEKAKQSLAQLSGGKPTP